MTLFLKVTLVIGLSLATWSCSSSTRDDGYLAPPSDPTAESIAATKAKQELTNASYKSVGKPFGCDTDCVDEEIGFSEARSRGTTRSEDCSTQFSDKSLMTNSTQDGCRAYAQAYIALIDRQR